MTSTYYNGQRIENVETNPNNISKDIEEKASFLVSDFKNLLEDDFNESESDLNYNPENKKKSLDEYRIFGKRLFHDLRFNNVFYSKTQKWLGHITDITEDGFSAILKDLTNEGTDEFADFSKDEITSDDLGLIKKGATFYMSIGLISNNGTRKKDSEIRFQRLADFNEEDHINNGLDLTSDFINYFE